MKIIMIYDQIQSGAGIKDDHMVPLGATKDPVGPAVMMEPYLKKVGGRVVACLYCGDGFYEANADEVSRKLCAMVKKLRTGLQLPGIWENGGESRSGYREYRGNPGVRGHVQGE